MHSAPAALQKTPIARGACGKKKVLWKQAYSSVTGDFSLDFLQRKERQCIKSKACLWLEAARLMVLFSHPLGVSL